MLHTDHCTHKCRVNCKNKVFTWSERGAAKRWQVHWYFTNTFKVWMKFELILHFEWCFFVFRSCLRPFEEKNRFLLTKHCEFHENGSIEIIIECIEQLPITSRTVNTNMHSIKLICVLAIIAGHSIFVNGQFGGFGSGFGNSGGFSNSNTNFQQNRGGSFAQIATFGTAQSNTNFQQQNSNGGK